MIERWQQELNLVATDYGEITRSPNLDWFVIPKFPLPAGWNKSETTLAMRIPPGYPTTQPYAFMVDEDLRLIGDTQPSNTSITQFENRQWLQFSFAVDEWQPHAEATRGHNLLTFLLGVKQRLMELN